MKKAYAGNEFEVFKGDVGVVDSFTVAMKAL